jgi:hypothetical protein
MAFMNITPMTLETVGNGVRKVTDGIPVMLNEKEKRSNDVVKQGSSGFLPDWDWLDDVGAVASNVISTAATSWAQARAGLTGSESVTTNQGDVASTNIQGDPNTQSMSFFEKNQTPLIVAGGVIGLAVIVFAFRK